MTHRPAMARNPFEATDDTGIAAGVAGAWRRLWGRREADPTPPAYWTSGVTYRGYLGAGVDTPDAWMNEQQMKETQALLRMAAAAGRLGAWSVELAGMGWTWSDEVKAIHGVTPDFMPSPKTVLPLYTEDSQDLLRQGFEQCAERGLPFDLDLQLVTPGGDRVWIHVLGEADRDAEGRITHVRGAMQDVSRFRAVADEARRTAERFTQTLERLSDGFVLLDEEWRFVYLNAEAERILRRRRQQLAGRSLLVEFPDTAAGRFLEKCEQALKVGQSVEFEKYYPPLGMWLHMKFSPSDLGMTLCIHDDTERINARRENLTLQAQIEALGGRKAGT
jgi:PAS domain S-box-containing protein